MADATTGEILATVEVAAPAESVFNALASDEITGWWARPGVFDTRKWTGEVRMGGSWQCSGLVRGVPYGLQGQYLEVDPPVTLRHTYERTDVDDDATEVGYWLSPSRNGTRIVLHHFGFTSSEACTNNAAGWVSSLAKLRELFPPRPGQAISALGVARAYHDAWTRRDYEEAWCLISEDVNIEVPINSYDSKGSFVAMAEMTREMTSSVTPIAEFGNAKEAALIYDLELPTGNLRITEVFAVDHGEITRITHIHDTAALRAAGVGRSE